MVDILLFMLSLLGIIVVGFLILAVVGLGLYAILYAVYKLFIEKDDRSDGNKSGR